MAAISQRLGEIRMGFMILSRLPMGEIRGQVPDMGAFCVELAHRRLRSWAF